jgi:hypothetical protein
MPGARKALLLGGVIAIFIGLMWIGLGSGPYPGSTFVIGEIAWACRIFDISRTYGGLVVAILGVIAVATASRMAGRQAQSHLPI